MRKFNTRNIVVSHLLATLVSGIIFLIIPGLIAFLIFVALIIGSLITGDEGGPLFFPMLILGGIFWAIVIIGLLLLFSVLTTFLHLLRRYIPFSWWTPVLIALPFFSAVILQTESGDIYVSLFLSAVFCLYWISFNLGFKNLS